METTNISYRNKEWLHQKIMVENLNHQQVADLCGVAKATIADWCMKLRVVKKNYPKTNRDYGANTDKLKNTEWLKYHYITLGWSYGKIAKHLGVGKTTVSKAIQNNPDISQRPPTIDLKGTGLREVPCANCGKIVKRKKARAESQDWFSCSDNCFYTYLKEVLKDEERIKILQESCAKWRETDEGKAQMKLNGVLGMMAQKDRETSIEKKIREFLETLNVEFEPQYPMKYYVVDFFLPEYDLVIECHGDYWHHNPNTRSSEPSNIIKDNMKRDKAKKTYLTNRGHDLLILWENDINNNFDVCTKKIMEKLSE